MEYTKSAITNLIIPLFLKEFQSHINIFILILLCFTTIHVVFRIIQGSIKQENGIQLVPFIVQLMVVIIGTISLPFIFKWILWFFNSLADLYFTVEDASELVSKIWSRQTEERMRIKLTNLNGHNFLIMLAGFLGLVTFYTLGLWRFFILSRHFLMGPYILSMSFLPNYGFNIIIRYFQDIIQVSSWTLLHSLFNLIMLTFATTLNFDNTDTLESLSYTMVYVVLMVVYFLSVKDIPSIACHYFGGNNYSNLTTMTSAISLGILKTIGKFPKASQDYALEKLSEQKSRMPNKTKETP